MLHSASNCRTLLHIAVSYLLPGLGISLLTLPPLLQTWIPLAILRLIPLVSSTVSLQWAVDEFQFLSSWTDLADVQCVQSPMDYNHCLAQWFSIWGIKGVSDSLHLLSRLDWLWSCQCPLHAGQLDLAVYRPKSVCHGCDPGTRSHGVWTARIGNTQACQGGRH